MIEPFVSASWVVEHRDTVVLCDVRWYLDGRSGLAEYAKGHVPGAVFVDLDAALAAPPSPAAGRHPLPDPEVFAHAMGGLGIGDDDVVVAYDDAGGSVAARLAWMLRATGHDAAVLEGGLQSWDGPHTRDLVLRDARRFTARHWPEELLSSIDATAGRAIDAALSVVVDVRAVDRYRGDVEPVDARAGHIPGARSLPYLSLLDEHHHVRSRESVHTELVELGIFEDTEVVAYCGSGVTSCLLLLALEREGIHGRLFPGSWSQWAADPAREVSTGARP